MRQMSQTTATASQTDGTDRMVRLRASMAARATAIENMIDRLLPRVEGGKPA